jgi:hypothetical protein
MQMTNDQAVADAWRKVFQTCPREAEICANRIVRMHREDRDALQQRAQEYEQTAQAIEEIVREYCK